jgi:dolichyl-phosphate-mannose--protein O-mannosyl transferase
VENPTISKAPPNLALTSLALGIVALTLFMAGIDKPATLVYDEFNYVSSAKAFLAGAPNPNPEHPPLAKLLIAAGIEAAGDNPVGWRAASAVCGALTLMAVFLWAYLLLRNYALALTAAGLTLFNNFLFVMSRTAMLDVFLEMFLIWGLVAFSAALELNLTIAKRRILLCLAGVMWGFAGACKWSAVDTLVVAVAGSAALFWMANRSALNWDERIPRYGRNLQQIGILPIVLCLIVAPVIAYGLTFWPLCRSLHRPFGIRELIAMNVFMWRFQTTVQANRAIISAWYTWPFQTSPQRALSYLLGNFVVMWGGLLALAFCVWRFFKSLAPREGLVLILYAANLLQWAFTPHKGMYYYYYTPAAMFLGVAIALVLNQMPPRIFGVRVGLILLLAAATMFLWCYPRMAHLEPPWDCALGCWP